MQELNVVQQLAVWALPVLFAITLHEVAHGWVARYFGDKTAERLGRLSFNPLRHIDPIGTVVVPAALMLMGGFLFGWAKPVPITYENLRHPKRDMAWVAVAGPFSNLLMAVFWIVILKLTFETGSHGSWFGEPLSYMAQAGIQINAVMFALNLLPLPPLDGSRLVTSWLADRWAWQYNRLEPYGMFILVGLLITGILGQVLMPLVAGTTRALTWLVGL